MKKQPMKRAALVLLALCLALLPCTALAADSEVIASGEEATFSWKLTDDGTMTVSGTEIPDVSNDHPIPWTDYKDKIQSVVIEEGITTIGAQAFENCENLTKLSLADTVTSIGSMSFQGTGLTSVFIPASVSYMDFGMYTSFNNDVAFEVAEGNPSYFAVDGVLYSDTEILSVPASYSGILTIPEGIKYIPWNLFFGDTRNITEFFLPASFESLEPGLFGDPRSDILKAIHVAEENPYYCSIDGILYNKEVTEIVLVPGGKTNVAIAEGVTSVGLRLAQHINLVSVTIPASVTEFANGFEECEKLETVIFKGNAPQFPIGEGGKLYDVFRGVTANVYYPAGNTTWTEENMLDYGGTLTWIPYYPVLEGDGSAVTEDDGKTVSVRVDAPIEKFEAVEVDGQALAKEHYDVTAGSTVVTLHADYLATLPTGEHSLTVRFADGSATASFTVKAAEKPAEPTPSEKPVEPTPTEKPANPAYPDNPKTGDTALLIPAVLMSVCVLSLLCLNRKKRAQ